MTKAVLQMTLKLRGFRQIVLGERLRSFSEAKMGVLIPQTLVSASAS